jgi:NTP pyrophosphatase (non-canonical NTP hydrolase)
MDLNEYQRAARRTSGADNVTKLTIAISAMGLAGEAGEVVDLLKKQIGHGHDADLEKLSKEIGDCLWYLSDLATLHGLSLDEIAQANIAKLLRRYPTGFSSEASRNRTE